MPQTTATSNSSRSGNTLLTPFNWVLLLLMAFGAVTFVARFALGLGGSTNLSDTYPWGLWILFDLVWIAVAAGAFAMAGVIYVFQRKDLYGLGRTAVLMGLLSYSFVMVTLLADLGLPWHSYQLALQAPEHSAMFEVSWCVGLYVTILLLEFLPVPFERWGYQRAAAALRRWNGAYVAAAVTLFVYLLSRNLLYALATAVIFGALAWIFRARDQKAEPIMLAIAAVTLSTMHQSSLGSLYLLMPNMLAPQWWSPVMPVSFFLSSIAAGTALVILIDMWIAKGWRRPLEITRLASVGQIAFWALLVYLVFRLGDMAIRNQLSGAFAGTLGMAFAAEILLGGVLPLILLARRSLRQRADVLFVASLLAVLGVAYNRMNVVLFAMTFRGRMPWGAPESYAPSIVEWGVSIGLIAATIFLFGLAARHHAGSLPARSRARRIEPMTPDLWVEAHAYLRPVADLSAQVDRAAAGIDVLDARIPDWEDYRADFLAGVPLLSSADAAVDLEPGGRMAAALLERLASGTSSGRLATETRALDTELRREPQVSRRIADFLLGDETLTPPFPGLLRYLAWTAMARFLRPVVNAFDGWRDEERWLRRYCPTCGSLPAMAQLVGVDPGRMRLLSCGCCGTRWQFKRTGCPFCETDSQRLASVTIEGEAGLRIDHCESCGGYLKTYDGQGHETLLLSDWSSLHLDLIAHDRGLKRLAASLYEFEPAASSHDPSATSGDLSTEQFRECRMQRLRIGFGCAAFLVVAAVAAAQPPPAGQPAQQRPSIPPRRSPRNSPKGHRSTPARRNSGLAAMSACTASTDRPTAAAAWARTSRPFPMPIPCRAMSVNRA